MRHIGKVIKISSKIFTLILLGYLSLLIFVYQKPTIECIEDFYASRHSVFYRLAIDCEENKKENHSCP